jgi:acyl-CoA synthetase (AMP-forming)/AMP-acid ligase II
MMKLDDLTAEISATRQLICAAADRVGQIAFVGGARPDGGPGGESYSYASFASTVQAAAAGLTWRGLRPRDVVGVMVPDAASFVIAMHAVRAAGGVPSPVDAALRAVETAGQLAESGARMVITSPPLAEGALAAADRSWVRQVFSFADAAGTTRFSDLLGLDMIRPSAGRPEEVAVLPFSRGQDGRLRPVPITHREFIDALDRADRTAGISDHDLVLAMPPTGDGLAYTTLVDCALLRGATVVVVRKQELAMAAIAHQGTVAIVPSDMVASVPEKVRALPVG